MLTPFLFFVGRQGPGPICFVVTCLGLKLMCVFRCMYQNQLCKMMSLFEFIFYFQHTMIDIFAWSQIIYVCVLHLLPFVLFWFSAIIVFVLANMTSNNGLCLSLICQDRSVAMGFGSHMHGNSCGAVFAAEVAFLFAWGQ